ncbi:polysaccharide pyruvyl transferase family protein [Alkalihalobacterium alkalinitrilicum]|uniref:polysaccharide pyruvyl transferase family protein n=1 Tax=Alkalihalobacterium alkalinitrilicum TaxID=427920 RepID=UPI00130363D8|nr:polysaccharide pyruvyl transferase family protein [Alkalihalobacterium alkalinitrilicum]
MRIGTLTYHQANNYGAVLQAYALQKFLINSGVETEVINYRPNPKASSLKLQRSFRDKVLHYLLNPKELVENKLKQHRFSTFRKRHLNISAEMFIGDEQIKINPPNYDLYIVGSDQVWNTDLSNSSKAYFLNFVKSGRRISYAASLGKDNFNEVEKEYVSKYLSKFNAISVRENLLQQNLEKDFLIKAKHVLDPIFLLDKKGWLKIANKVTLPKNFVLCYMMEYSVELIEHTKNVASQLNCTPIFISPSHSNFSGKKLKGLGPSEFIYTLAKARYICTNSFHGTAFSIIFKKDFTVVKHSNLNSRISSLINLVGLNKRTLDSEDFCIDEINYSEIEKKLNVEIEVSKNYLNEQLIN